GAGPLFATLLADELDIARVVVPRHAGNFSAWGLLGADVTRERSATRIIRLSDDGLRGAREQVNGLFALLEARGGNGDVRDARPGAEIAGPAILLEQTAVTYLDAGFVARVHESGTLRLERSG